MTCATCTIELATQTVRANNTMNDPIKLILASVFVLLTACGNNTSQEQQAKASGQAAESAKDNQF